MSITWIFTIISLFFCCVAAYNMKKIQKNNKDFKEIKLKEIAQNIKADVLQDCIDAENRASSEILGKANKISTRIISDAVGEALQSINSPKTEGYLVTSFSDTPQRYAVWRKCEMEKNFSLYTQSYGMGYILVKMFDSDNAEENLRNATELCRMLNEVINETV